MKSSIFCIYDSIGQYFTPPFFAINQGDAVRSVTCLVNSDQDVPICTNPNDFTLYEIGFFDDSSASIETHAQPQFMCVCSALVTKEDQNV